MIIYPFDMRTWLLAFPQRSSSKSSRLRLIWWESSVVLRDVLASKSPTRPQSGHCLSLWVGFLLDCQCEAHSRANSQRPNCICPDLFLCTNLSKGYSLKRLTIAVCWAGFHASILIELQLFAALAGKLYTLMDMPTLSASQGDFV